MCLFFSRLIRKQQHPLWPIYQKLPGIGKKPVFLWAWPEDRAKPYVKDIRFLVDFVVSADRNIMTNDVTRTKSVQKINVRLSLVHTSDISIRTRSIRKQRMMSSLGLAKTKQQDFFFVSSFVRLLAYAWIMILCLCLWLSSCRGLDFIPFFCFLFFSYAYS